MMFQQCQNACRKEVRNIERAFARLYVPGCDGVLQNERRHVLAMGAINRNVEGGLDIRNSLALQLNETPNIKLKLSRKQETCQQTRGIAHLLRVFFVSPIRTYPEKLGRRLVLVFHFIFECDGRSLARRQVEWAWIVNAADVSANG